MNEHLLSVISKLIKEALLEQDANTYAGLSGDLSVLADSTARKIVAAAKEIVVKEDVQKKSGIVILDIADKRGLHY